MKYERPARTFCDKYHEYSRWPALLHSYAEPRARQTCKALTVLTALCSACVQRPDDVIAAAICFDASNAHPTIVLAGNSDVSKEIRNFLVHLLDCLHELSEGPQLSNESKIEQAVVDIASVIFEHQAQRWMTRLHDNTDDKACWDTRLTNIRPKVDPALLVGLDLILGTVESIKLRARALFSGQGLNKDLVGDMVHRLLRFDELLSTQARALHGADWPMYSTAQVTRLLDPYLVLPADDVGRVEDKHGNLLADFSLTRYCVGILAIVRHARHLVLFTQSDRRFFASERLTLDFCDQQQAVDKSGELIWETRPKDDCTHAGMRVLQAILEYAECDVSFVPAVGSSAPLCHACYSSIVMLREVADTPETVPPRLYCHGSIQNEPVYIKKPRLLSA